MSPDELARQKDAAAERLLEKAAANGAVRVIVGVASPFWPEGTLDRDAVVAQRGAIRSLADKVMGAMPAASVSEVKRFESLPYFAATVNDAALRALQVQSDVVSIQEDHQNRPSLMNSAPLVGANVAWNYGVGGAGWALAVLDTGVDRYHAFLSGKIVSEACYSTTSPTYGSQSICPGGVDSTANGSATPCPYGCSHGTHVAGIAAGRGSSFSGIARDASVIAVQVFSAKNDGTVTAWDSDVILGLQRIMALRTTFNIAAVNMSLGGNYYSSQAACDFDHSAYKAAIDNLRSTGIATVVASGNDGYSYAISSPACVSSAISVGATTKSDLIAGYSNDAPFLTLLAPGSSIYSSVPGGSYAYMSGTSMAAPHVTGAWAILKSVKPAATVSEIANALRATGKSILNPYSGFAYRRIQIDAAGYSLLNGGAVTPGPPANLVVSSSGSSVQLSWSPPASGGAPTSYVIEAGSASGLANLANFSTGTTSTTYATSGVGSGVYYVRVRAANAAGTGGPSNEAVLNVAGAAPGAPTGLTASASGNSVSLLWRAPASGGVPTSYIIEAGSAPGLADLAYVPTGTTATTFSTSGVGAGTYYVRVRASNAAGTSAPSNESVLIVGTTSPGPPSGLTASAAGSSVLLSWQPPSTGGAPASYIIEAGSAPGRADLGNFNTWNTATSYATAGVGVGTYYVRVRSSNAGGTSAPSNEALLIVTGAGCAGPPPAPTALAGTVVGNVVYLSWKAPPGLVTSYVLQAGTAPGLVNVASSDLGSTATSFSAPGIPSGTYYIRVRAVNPCGTGASSNEVSVTVASATLPGPNLQIVPGTLTVVPAVGGSAILYGELANTGGGIASFGEVFANFISPYGTVLESDRTYVYGRSRRLSASGLITDTTLGPGESGCFVMFPNTPYANISNVSTTVGFDSYGVSSLVGSIGFSGTPQASVDNLGDILVTGTAINKGGVLTYFNKIFADLKNAQGRVTGCDFTYVKGSSVTLSSGITTDTALWPVQSGPFADYTITPASNFAGGSVWPTWEEPYNGVLSAGELDAIDAARVQVNTGAAADPPARGRWEQQRRLTEAIRSIEAARQQPSAR